MSVTLRQALAGVVAIGAWGFCILPADAMPVAPDRGARMPIESANWSDRIRGRTSSSTPPLGYGWLWGDEDLFDPGDARPSHARPRYDRYRNAPAPYGYEDGDD